MNEIDPYLSLPLYVLYEIQNQIFQQFMCFGIAKLECQKPNIIGYFFSISYMLMHDLLKRKICKEKKNALYIIASVYTKRCGSYKIYIEGDSLHQTIIIVCELK